MQQFTTRYRHALVARAAVLVAVGVGIIAVLAWRLRIMRLAPAWTIAAPAALALLGAIGLAWGMRRRWISHRASAPYLDHALGLQQRLTTAAEFAHEAQAPALYSLLVEDAASHLSTERLRVPRPVDRIAGALVLVLLLLLCWPMKGGVPLLQLAQLPSPTPPQPPPPKTEPPPPQDQKQDSTQQSAHSTQQQEGQGSQSQPSGGGQSPQPSPSQGGGGQPPPSSGASGSTQNSPGATGQSNRSPEGRGQGQSGTPQPQAGSQGQQASPGAQPSIPKEGERQDARGGQQPRDTTQQSTQSAQQRGKSGEQQSGAHSPQHTAQSRKEDRASGQGQPAGAKTGTEEAHATQQGGQQGTAPQQASASLQEQAGRGGGQSLGNQEAMKAEIQQLLKEVSGELKQLQAQLASAKEQPHPEAGTGTDPNLYEAPMALERAIGSTLPIQLQTDTAEAKTKRPGSGVGQPSGEVSGATPQARPEEATLSDEPTEETPASRQPVPPEYRSAFDRLHRRDAPPTTKRDGP